LEHLTQTDAEIIRVRRRLLDAAKALAENGTVPPGVDMPHAYRYRSGWTVLPRTVDFWGSIASIGLTGSPRLETTVLPFILRGVNLLGINSSATLRPTRLAVWKRISTDLKPHHFNELATRTIGFDDLPAAFPAYLEGGVTGRTVVKIS